MKLLITVALASLMFNSNLPTNHGKSSIKKYSASTDASMSKGWKTLFDGKSKKGWHIYGNEGDGTAWQVQDGALTLIPSTEKTSALRPGGDITTDAVYTNYHFMIDWKISEGGNSGIIFGVQEEAKYPQSYFTGLEMQVLDNDKHSDGQIIKHRAGDLYDLVSCKRETVKPVREWNHAEIIIKDDALTLILNGETVVTTTRWNDEWNKMLAGSKFAKMPGFGSFKSGRISLQDHGNQVWYKNIKIKEL